MKLKNYRPQLLSPKFLETTVLLTARLQDAAMAPDGVQRRRHLIDTNGAIGVDTVEVLTMP